MSQHHHTNNETTAPTSPLPPPRPPKTGSTCQLRPPTAATSPSPTATAATATNASSTSSSNGTAAPVAAAVTLVAGGSSNSSNSTANQLPMYRRRHLSAADDKSSGDGAESSETIQARHARLRAERRLSLRRSSAHLIAAAPAAASQVVVDALPQPQQQQQQQQQQQLPANFSLWLRPTPLLPPGASPAQISAWKDDLTSCRLDCTAPAAADALNNPPYKIENGGGTNPTYAKTLSMNALHANGNVTHYDAHNLYGMSQSLATAAAVQLATGARPFVLSRSTYPGSGRFVSHWTGDNAANWDNLRWSVQGLLNSNLWGIPMAGGSRGRRGGVRVGEGMVAVGFGSAGLSPSVLNPHMPMMLAHHQPPHPPKPKPPNPHTPMMLAHHQPPHPPKPQTPNPTRRRHLRVPV
jgi:hypothetical protein